MAINDNARYAYRYLQERYKLTPAQAAGVVGNLVQESGLRTSARNRGDGRDGSDSIGIAQWNGERARNLHAFAKDGGRDAGNLDTQLDFLMHELNGKDGKYGAGSESAAYQKLINSQTHTDATKAFIGYERPQGWSAKNPTGGHGWKNRHDYAGQILGLSPDEIAAARGTSSELGPETAAAIAPSSGEAIQPVQTTETIEPEEKKGLFGITLPDEIAGINTETGIGALGDLAKLFAAQDASVNQQAPRGGRAGSQNVELMQANTGGLLGGNAQGQQQAQLMPWEMELMRLRQKMGSAGGLGGLGGMRGFV
ncbi:phage tail tip lysozyme [Shinella sp. S4-D37]|uniref:phage tail tip lysozyme n=1 Tax=Shinella sp. S4-D37 TaxID=3161999 RepID=UPI003467A4F7